MEKFESVRVFDIKLLQCMARAQKKTFEENQYSKKVEAFNSYD